MNKSNQQGHAKIRILCTRMDRKRKQYLGIIGTFQKLWKTIKNNVDSVTLRGKGFNIPKY